jgi:thymidine kinase
MSFTMNSGYLEIYLGCMFSGKTTELIKIYKKNTFIGKKVVVLNFVGDVRYGAMLSTHDSQTCNCISITTLSEIWTNDNHLNFAEIHDADVILINEGQFFTDLFDVVLEMVEVEKKQVYICGLDGDFQRKRFGSLLDLIPYCDKVIKLNALCSNCKNGKKAAFSFRSTEEIQQVVIGSTNYKPLCRSCYLQLNR